MLVAVHPTRAPHLPRWHDRETSLGLADAATRCDSICAGSASEELRTTKEMGTLVHWSIYTGFKEMIHRFKTFLNGCKPPGPVILVGHSMGGLLAADAATDPSNKSNSKAGSKHKRIFSVITFDTPFLGMHPHVVVSGIASLLPKNGDKKGAKSEKEMNPAQTPTQTQLIGFGIIVVGTQRGPSSSPSPSPIYPDPPSPGSLNSPRIRTPSPFVNRAIDFVSTHSDSRFVQWVKKHADDPIGAGKKFIVESFQFGSCMFDPSGLRERYSKLVEWDGDLWINYWTQTPPRLGKESKKEHNEEVVDNDMALLENGISGLDVNSSIHSEPANQELSPAELKIKSDLRKQVEKERKNILKHKKKKSEEGSKVKSGHHFSVLPTGLGQVLGGSEKWEKVVIAGVNNEVAAHCGLFIRGQNLDYDDLVERIGTKIFSWCEKL
ncbi:hypothetical protein BDQ17DRAFT_1420177 [Cyathus striatus]|nr:hypothetical protein BDQ17DRAFT_1420177 [Cyathus striatus]